VTKWWSGGGGGPVVCLSANWHSLLSNSISFNLF